MFCAVMLHAAEHCVLHLLRPRRPRIFRAAKRIRLRQCCRKSPSTGNATLTPPVDACGARRAANTQSTGVLYASVYLHRCTAAVDVRTRRAMVDNVRWQPAGLVRLARGHVAGP
jgi:hypothetical protein